LDAAKTPTAPRRVNSPVRKTLSAKISYLVFSGVLIDRYDAQQLIQKASAAIHATSSANVVPAEFARWRPAIMRG
jgi:hypothetical protein